MPARTRLRRAGMLCRPSWQSVSATLQSRSNQLRNGSMQGAVAGTPGTAPTNWVVGATGLTVQQSAVGIQNGLDIIDYRLSGTTGATSATISFETSTGVDALSGQVWTESAFLAIVAGAKTNITSLFFTVTENTAAGAFVANNDGADFLASLSPVLQRFSATRTLAGGGTVAKAWPRLRMAWSSAVAVDITLRIGRPMFHQGSVALSPLRTSGVALSGVHSSMIARV